MGYKPKKTWIYVFKWRPKGPYTRINNPERTTKIRAYNKEDAKKKYRSRFGVRRLPLGIKIQRQKNWD